MGTVQKWELTRGALDRLLARLDPDPSAAGEKYEHLRRSLVKFFSWRGTPDVESSADATLDRLARRLNTDDAIDDVPAFAYGVARLIHLERQRQAAAMPMTGDEVLLTRAAPASTHSENQEIRDGCLQRCLSELAREDRDLVVNYYVGAGRQRIEERVRLATALGVSDNALRLRIQRLRDRLRGCAARCVERGGVGRDGRTT